MRTLSLSATTIAILLSGATSPVMAQQLVDSPIFDQYVRECILIKDGSVRAFVPRLVRNGGSGRWRHPVTPSGKSRSSIAMSIAWPTAAVVAAVAARRAYCRRAGQ